MSDLLLIDDDQELCELLASWLSQEGFQVRACHDGNACQQQHGGNGGRVHYGPDDWRRDYRRWH